MGLKENNRFFQPLILFYCPLDNVETLRSSTT
ncbi:hypothetical protein predicted by Glimmer/Critica [Limosilactobacillus fermentum]|nr:hypothetical protein predicted by Glimmer/Critica [Limosilactobacillus fermentum]